MADAGAPIGNTNAAKGKQWADQIRKALIQYEDDQVKRGSALFKIAENVVRAALAGDKDAIQEIGNRLDGRAAQSLTVSGDEDRPLINLVKMVVVRADADANVIEHTHDVSNAHKLEHSEPITIEPEQRLEIEKLSSAAADETGTHPHPLSVIVGQAPPVV